MPISLIKTCFCCKKSLQMGISPGLCGIFQSSWVHWKEHNAYFHWFQAQYVIICGPRAMGQAPGPPPPPLGHLLKNRPTSEACLFSVWGSLKLKYFFLGWKICLFWPPNMPPPWVWKGSRRPFRRLQAYLSFKGLALTQHAGTSQGSSRTIPNPGGGVILGGQNRHVLAPNKNYLS